ncbi:unnamed protein product [Bemisia tabaci]|uniref:Uncharacterized protein n=1 Tax=Bemisia tabaci TaxID=7038 RepID=A0A9N9ZXG0_BEMTA|nr:unnamed protein product [Bemisia tabaci]
MEKPCGNLVKKCRPMLKNLFPTCVLIVYFFVLSNIQMVMSRTVPNHQNSIELMPSGKNNTEKRGSDPEKMDLYPYQYGRHPYRHKRQLNYEMTLEEGQFASMCSYEIKVDTNPKRIPEKITRVECRNQGCVCAQMGNYKCTQLVSQVHVQYRDSEESQEVHKYETIKVPYACTCALRVSVDSKTVPTPEIV